MLDDEDFTGDTVVKLANLQLEKLGSTYKVPEQFARLMLRHTQDYGLQGYCHYT